MYQQDREGMQERNAQWSRDLYASTHFSFASFSITSCNTSMSGCYEKEKAGTYTMARDDAYEIELENLVARLLVRPEYTSLVVISEGRRETYTLSVINPPRTLLWKNPPGEMLAVRSGIEPLEPLLEN